MILPQMLWQFCNEMARTDTHTQRQLQCKAFDYLSELNGMLHSY